MDEDTSPVKRSSETSAIERSLQQSCERDTHISGYLTTIAEITRQEMPAGAVLEVWFRSLSSYCLSAIKWAFEDYIAHGVDDRGNFWFPAPAQIGSRCQTYLNVEEGKNRSSFQDELAEWKRDKEAHPEKYIKSFAEVAAMAYEVVGPMRNSAGLEKVCNISLDEGAARLAARLPRPEMSDEQVEARRKELLQQARDMEQKHREEKIQ